MNLQILDTLTANGTDQGVTVPRDYALVIRSIGADCDVREVAGSTSKMTIDADTLIKLGRSLGQTIYLRSVEGTQIELALL